MKATTIIAAVFATLTVANPIIIPEPVLEDLAALEKESQLETRQTSDTANEFIEGGCRANIFIFARGSAETGNMVCVTVSLSSTYIAAVELVRVPYIISH